MAKTKVQTEGEDEIVLITPEQIKLIEETVETNLAKNNITNTLIAGFKKEYMALKINGPEDKEGFEIVYAARQKTKNTRILIKNICKAGRAPLKAEADEWMKKEKELVAEVVPIEAHLQKEEDTYEEQKEAEKKKKVEAQIERNKIRVAELKALGVEWDGASYTLDDISYSAETIRETEDDFFEEKIIPQFKKIADAKEAIAKANREALELQEKQQQEARKELERQQEEFRQEQIKMQEAHKKLDRDRHEAQQYRQDSRLNIITPYREYWRKDLDTSKLHELPIDDFKDILEIMQEDAKKDSEAKAKREAAQKIQDEKQSKRIDQLYKLGLTFDFNESAFVNFTCYVHQLDIQTNDDEKWDAIIIKLTDHIAEYKKHEAAKNAARIEKEKQDAIALAEKQRQEREQLAEQKRQQEIEEGKESVKYAETVNYLKATPIYTFRSGRYIAKMRIIRDFLADLEKQ